MDEDDFVLLVGEETAWDRSCLSWIEDMVELFMPWETSMLKSPRSSRVLEAAGGSLSMASSS